MGMPFPNPMDPELCERMRFQGTTAGRFAAKRPHSHDHSCEALSCPFLPLETLCVTIFCSSCAGRRCRNAKLPAIQCHCIASHPSKHLPDSCR